MNVQPDLPYFVFAYVRRTPQTLALAVKLPAVRHQFGQLNAFTSVSGRKLGRCFMKMTTYRPKAFIDYPEFDAAVSVARENGTMLLVGDLTRLLSAAPFERFADCVTRLDRLDIDVCDAKTSTPWREFSATRKTAIHVMALDRGSRGKMISAGRSKGKRPAGNLARRQAAGARSNHKRALAGAERIRPVVDEMEAVLPAGERLSPSAVMHRLNERGIKGPRSDHWSLNAVKRYLRILARRGLKAE